MRKHAISAILSLFVTLFVIGSANAGGYWKVVWDNDVSVYGVDHSQGGEVEGDYDQYINYFTAGPGSLSAEIKPHLQWVPELPLSAIPDTVTVRMESYIDYLYYMTYSSTYPTTDNPTITHSLGPITDDYNELGQDPYSPGNYIVERHITAGGVRYVTLNTMGQSIVPIEEEINVSVSNVNMPEEDPGVIAVWGMMMDLTNAVEIVNFSISGTPEKLQSVLDNKPTYKEYVVIVKLNFRDVGLELPFEPYWEGKSTYELSIPTYDGIRVFDQNSETYTWTISGAPTLLLAPNGATQNEIDEADISIGTKKKTLRIDFGDDASQLPVTTSVVGKVGGTINGDTNDTPKFTGNIKINWVGPWGPGVDYGNINAWRINGQSGAKIPVPPYNDENGDPVIPSEKDIEDLNPGDVVIIGGEPKEVIAITYNSDTDSYTATYGPVLPSLPEYDEETDLMNYADEVMSRNQLTKEVGTLAVGTTLEIYKSIAEEFAYGPFTNLAGAGAIKVIGKGIKLIENINQLKSKYNRIANNLDNTVSTIARIESRLNDINLPSAQRTALELKLNELYSDKRDIQGIKNSLEDSLAQLDRHGVDYVDALGEAGLLNKVYDDVPANIPPGAPGSPQHKADAWLNYQNDPNNAGWAYERWSNQYDFLMHDIRKADDAANAYGATLGWGSPQIYGHLYKPALVSYRKFF